MLFIRKIIFILIISSFVMNISFISSTYAQEEIVYDEEAGNQYEPEGRALPETLMDIFEKDPEIPALVVALGGLTSFQSYTSSIYKEVKAVKNEQLRSSVAGFAAEASDSLNQQGVFRSFMALFRKYGIDVDKIDEAFKDAGVDIEDEVFKKFKEHWENAKRTVYSSSGVATPPIETEVRVFKEGTWKNDIKEKIAQVQQEFSVRILQELDRAVISPLYGVLGDNYKPENFTELRNLISSRNPYGINSSTADDIVKRLGSIIDDSKKHPDKYKITDSGEVKAEEAKAGEAKLKEVKASILRDSESSLSAEERTFKAKLFRTMGSSAEIEGLTTLIGNVDPREGENIIEYLKRIRQELIEKKSSSFFVLNDQVNYLYVNNPDRFQSIGDMSVSTLVRGLKPNALQFNRIFGEYAVEVEQWLKDMKKAGFDYSGKTFVEYMEEIQKNESNIPSNLKETYIKVHDRFFVEGRTALIEGVQVTELLETVFTDSTIQFYGIFGKDAAEVEQWLEDMKKAGFDYGEKTFAEYMEEIQKNEKSLPNKALKKTFRRVYKNFFEQSRTVLIDGIKVSELITTTVSEEAKAFYEIFGSKGTQAGESWFSRITSEIPPESNEFFGSYLDRVDSTKLSEDLQKIHEEMVKSFKEGVVSESLKNVPVSQLQTEIAKAQQITVARTFYSVFSVEGSEAVEIWLQNIGEEITPNEGEFLGDYIDRVNNNKKSLSSRIRKLHERMYDNFSKKGMQGAAIKDMKASPVINGLRSLKNNASQSGVEVVSIPNDVIEFRKKIGGSVKGINLVGEWFGRLNSAFPQLSETETFSAYLTRVNGLLGNEELVRLLEPDNVQLFEDVLEFAKEPGVAPPAPTRWGKVKKFLTFWKKQPTFAEIKARAEAIEGGVTGRVPQKPTEGSVENATKKATELESGEKIAASRTRSPARSRVFSIVDGTTEVVDARSVHKYKALQKDAKVSGKVGGGLLGMGVLIAVPATLYTLEIWSKDKRDASIREDKYVTQAKNRYQYLFKQMGSIMNNEVVGYFANSLNESIKYDFRSNLDDDDYAKLIKKMTEIMVLHIGKIKQPKGEEPMSISERYSDWLKHVLKVFINSSGKLGRDGAFSALNPGVQEEIYSEDKEDKYIEERVKTSLAIFECDINNFGNVIKNAIEKYPLVKDFLGNDKSIILVENSLEENIRYSMYLPKNIELLTQESDKKYENWVRQVLKTLNEENEEKKKIISLDVEKYENTTKDNNSTPTEDNLTQIIMDKINQQFRINESTGKTW